jgi:hypothetical protein
MRGLRHKPHHKFPAESERSKGHTLFAHEFKLSSSGMAHSMGLLSWTKILEIWFYKTLHPFKFPLRSHQAENGN